MADTLAKGCRVRLHGLNTLLLNGAEGCIVGPIDEETGRHPVKLLKPSEAVSAYPTGVKVKPANLERVQLTPARPKKASAGGQGGGGAASGPGGPLDAAGWAKGLSSAEQTEWLVDCYRMRVDDDYVWGGGNLHGAYDPDHTPDTLASDFLVFCKLAVQNGVVPKSGWNWKKFYEKAAGMIMYAFEKSDAQEKYGSEHVANAFMGGRSLRITAELVYGTSCMGGERSSAHEQVQELAKSEPISDLIGSQPKLFEDVGGADQWMAFLKALHGSHVPSVKFC